MYMLKCFVHTCGACVSFLRLYFPFVIEWNSEEVLIVPVVNVDLSM